jgi:hypothetical protein
MEEKAETMTLTTGAGGNTGVGADGSDADGASATKNNAYGDNVEGEEHEDLDESGWSASRSDTGMGDRSTLSIASLR